MKLTNNDSFSSEYRDALFAIWYKNGECSMTRLAKIIPEDSTGRLPSLYMLRSWKEAYGWVARAESLNVQVHKQMNDGLVAERARMLQRHVDLAKQLQELGLEYLLDSDRGITSDTVALRAVIEGIEIERNSTGMESLSELLTLSDKQIESRMQALLKKAGNSVMLDGELLQEDDDNEDGIGEEGE